MIRALFIIIMGFLSRKRLGVLDESVVTMRVWPTDLDNIGWWLTLPYVIIPWMSGTARMPSMNYLRYFTRAGRKGSYDIARVKGLRAPWRLRWRRTYGGMTINYLKPLRLFQKYQIRSRLSVCWDEKWFYTEHRFERDGVVMAIVLMKWLVLGPAGKIPTSEVVQLVGASPVSPPIPPAIEHWRQSDASLTKG